MNRDPSRDRRMALCTLGAELVVGVVWREVKCCEMVGLDRASKEP